MQDITKREFYRHGKIQINFKACVWTWFIFFDWYIQLVEVEQTIVVFHREET